MLARRRCYKSRLRGSVGVGWEVRMLGVGSMVGWMPAVPSYVFVDLPGRRSASHFIFISPPFPATRALLMADFHFYFYSFFTILPLGVQVFIPFRIRYTIVVRGTYTLILLPYCSNRYLLSRTTIFVTFIKQIHYIHHFVLIVR